MLSRALALSCILHLVGLFGIRSIEQPLLNGGQFSTEVLTVRLAQFPSNKFLSAARLALAPEIESLPLIARKLLKEKATPSGLPVFPKFSPSTAAVDMTAPAGKSEKIQLVHGAQASQPSPMVAKDLPTAAVLGAYRLALAREARQFKEYPALARERSWEGVVMLEIHVMPNSAVPLVKVERGSGHQELDDQALTMMQQAALKALMPESLRGRQFSISLPIYYRLAE